MKNFLFFINHIENSISKTLLYYLLLVTVSVSSFLIGATSNLIENRGTMEIKNLDGTNYQDLDAHRDENATSSSIDKTLESFNGKNEYQDKSIIFASVKGKYFYYKGCGGESIAKKNLRYYKSEAEAIKAGKKLYNKCE